MAEEYEEENMEKKMKGLGRERVNETEEVVSEESGEKVSGGEGK